MLKKTITYSDYNGVERTEDFYFNLTRAEILDMQLGTVGGFEASLMKIIQAKDVPTLIKEFKKIILSSYGVKSDDGRRFMKSKEITDNFSQTEAFSQLYMELVFDDEKAADFIKGIMPKDISNQLDDKEIKKKAKELTK